MNLRLVALLMLAGASLLAPAAERSQALAVPHLVDETGRLLSVAERP